LRFGCPLNWNKIKDKRQKVKDLGYRAQCTGQE